MLFSARHIPADETLDMGIATEVVESTEDLEGSVQRWVELLRNRPTKSLGYMKQSIYRAFENDFESGFELMRAHRVLVEMTDDFKEGKTAWLGKREPEFNGR